MSETSAGRLALVGSGEYLPVMTEVEDWLFANNDRVYVQLATAAAPEGSSSLDYWHRLGAESAARLGAKQVIVDVRTREDAFEQRWVDAIAGAGAIYLSGGNPIYLTETLRGTPVWHAISRAWQAGAGLGGCSAGAMSMGGYVPHYRHPRSGGTDGLGVVPQARVLPHFDRYTKWMPDFALRPLIATGATVLGIDEDTALTAEQPETGSRWSFTPRGRQSAYEVTRGGSMLIENIDLEVQVT